MTLVHKRFGQTVRFDFWCGNGILGAFGGNLSIAWNKIICAIGYSKQPGWFGARYGIAIGSQERDGEIQVGEVLCTGSEWQYRYFLEKTVLYLCNKMNALGGESWCARLLTPDGSLGENDHYSSYVFCRIMADKLGVPWFEHSDEDEAVVATTYIRNKLVADGAEVTQLDQAIRQTRFAIQADGSISTLGSIGHRILDDHAIRLMSKRNQESSARH